MNPLGDGVSESLSCLLSCCPLLTKLSLQACSLTARFLQQHRLLLASALTGDQTGRANVSLKGNCKPLNLSPVFFMFGVKSTSSYKNFEIAPVTARMYVTLWGSSELF